jgi:DNA-directed RNA polymerase specialized sigma24 family protein
MSLSDDQLNQLAVSAQQFPPLTPERQSALRQLVNAVMQSGWLCRPCRGQFVGQYDEIHDEAVQDLLLYVCQNIDQYKLERSSVMGWLNMLLERRFFREAIPKVLGKPGMTRVSIDTIDSLSVPQDPPGLTDLLKASIKADPDNLFKREHLEGLPSVNFQSLVLRRLAGKSWKDIAAEFDIKQGTVSSFYSRCVKKFASTLRQYCVE